MATPLHRVELAIRPISSTPHPSSAPAGQSAAPRHSALRQATRSHQQHASSHDRTSSILPKRRRIHQKLKRASGSGDVSSDDVPARMLLQQAGFSDIATATASENPAGVGLASKQQPTLVDESDDDDLVSVSNSDSEPLLHDRQAPPPSMAAVASPPAAMIAPSVKEDSQALEQEAQTIIAQDEERLKQMKLSIELEIDKVMFSHSQALRHSEAIHGIENGTSDATRDAIASMKEAVLHAQHTCSAVPEFLTSQDSDAARIRTWSVRQEAVSVVTSGRVRVQGIESAIARLQPLLLIRCADVEPECGAEIEVEPESVQLQVEPECDVEIVPQCNDLVTRLVSMGLIVACGSDDVKHISGGSASFIPGVQKALEREDDTGVSECQLPTHVAKVPKLTICRGHKERCVLQRAKKTGRRFFCCQLTQAAGGCGFQRWIDKAPPQGSGEGNAAGSN